MKTEKRLTGLSSSADKLQITDASLCGIRLDGVDTEALHAYYHALLALGITFIQIPWEAAALLLAPVIEPERTVLSIPEGCQVVPPGFVGYLGTQERMQGAAIIECAVGSTPPAFAAQIRWTANDSLFFADYASEFSRLADGPRCGFCPRGAGEAGTALAVEWLLAGGQRLTAAFMGVGGYAPLEEVLAALHVYGELPPSARLERLPDVAHAYTQLTKKAIFAHKAVIGSALFNVESGVHVDGIAKNRQCYEPFAPEAVGAARRIIIGKHSGKQALKMKLDELGLHGLYDMDELLHLVRERSVCDGGGLSDDTFAALAKKAAGGDAA